MMVSQAAAGPGSFVTAEGISMSRSIDRWAFRVIENPVNQALCSWDELCSNLSCWLTVSRFRPPVILRTPVCSKVLSRKQQFCSVSS